MYRHSENPYLLIDFNFAQDSVFTYSRGSGSGIESNEFLLLDGTNFLLLDGEDLLLLGA